MGLDAFWYRRDWKEAIRCFRQAELLNPADSAPVMFLAHVHSVLQEHEQASAVIAAAHRMDPLSPIVATHVGHFLYNAGRYDAALTALDRAIEMAPHFWIAHLMQGKVLASLGRTEEALQAFLQSEQFGMEHTEPLAFRIFTLAQGGEVGEAQRFLQQLLEHTPPAPPLHQALAYLGLGALASAQHLIEQGFAEQDVRLVFVGVERRWRLLGREVYNKLLADAMRGMPVLSICHYGEQNGV